jgi:hypothetical protein
VEPRVHLSHVGNGGARSREENDRATEVSAATVQGITSIRVWIVNRTASSSRAQGTQGRGARSSVERSGARAEGCLACHRGVLLVLDGMFIQHFLPWLKIERFGGGSEVVVRS